MRIFITGICGFVGASLARSFKEGLDSVEVFGIDNLIRPGAHLNRADLAASGIRVWHGDTRLASDLESLPPSDWVVDAAANPSVMAGVDGQTSSRQLVEHNLGGTVNVLEYCKRHGAGFVLLSTSRVYSVSALAGLPMRCETDRFGLDETKSLPAGASQRGISEAFSTAPPVSLYGSTKLCSEFLALEYGAAFGFPVWIDRCGVLAGAGQFGKIDQGIFSYWIHSWRARRPLKYIGFGGSGLQVRDGLHPEDLALLVMKQMGRPEGNGERIWNIGGGLENSVSLAELSAWCSERLGPHEVGADGAPRPYDIPWFVMDDSRARAFWQWEPQRGLESVLEEIAIHAEANPQWLELTA